MLRSLWTGASGMIAQQTNVDTISNNLANVNTVGYKKETVEFKSLLYQKLQTKVTDNNGDPKPVIGQVGSGVRTSAITSRFKQGNMVSTENVFDLAIDGNGFFAVQAQNGETAYTRSGSLVWAIGAEGMSLANSEGFPVLDVNGEQISVPMGTDIDRLEVDESGKIYEKVDVKYTNENGEEKSKTEYEFRAQIGIVQFNNPSGMTKISGTLFQESAASGEPRMEVDDSALKRSTIRSGYLEASNVQTVDEIVNLIVAQRAYEMNSKVITASDQMLQQANNLRG